MQTLQFCIFSSKSEKPCLGPESLVISCDCKSSKCTWHLRYMTRIQSINCDESQSFQLHNQTHANHSHSRRPTLLIPPPHIPKIAPYDKLTNNHYHNRTKSLRSRPDPQSKMGYTHRKLVDARFTKRVHCINYF